MAFPEYRLRQPANVDWVREQSEEGNWAAYKRKQTSSSESLEKEIYDLRCELEQLVRDGHELTSVVVVRISMLLDRKINEYMMIQRESRL